MGNVTVSALKVESSLVDYNTVQFNCMGAYFINLMSSAHCDVSVTLTSITLS